MNEYVYLLSNVSMPGLIKVGRTTNHPNQRIAELHSTGVPTRFELELSILVADSARCERLAHQALHQFRVADNREFFRVPVKKAISLILNAMPQYRIDDFNATLGVAEIEQEIAARKAEQARQEQAAIEAAKRQFDWEDLVRIQNLRAVEVDITRTKEALSKLGEKPVRKTLPGICVVLQMCYWPIPFGWMAWLGLANLFSPRSETIGGVCAALIFLGYLCNERAKEYDQAYDHKAKPFVALEETMRILQSRAEMLSRPLNRPIPPSRS